jgi:hypothetical protein
MLINHQGLIAFAPHPPLYKTQKGDSRFPTVTLINLCVLAVD